MTDTPKNLVEKLAEACDAVGGVEKKGKNRDQNYEYVKAADVAKAIRHELFSRGIVIFPHEESIEEKQFTTKSGSTATEVRLAIIYTVTDGKDTLNLRAWGIARDSSDKAIYKAKTGALKYFLRSLGLIPDELEDPETTHIEEEHEKEHLERLEPKLKGQQRITSAKAVLFANTAKKNNRTIEEITQFLHDLNGYIDETEITEDDWLTAQKWANTPPTDLTKAVSKAVEHARATKRGYYQSPEGIFDEHNV